MADITVLRTGTQIKNTLEGYAVEKIGNEFYDITGTHIMDVIPTVALKYITFTFDDNWALTINGNAKIDQSVSTDATPTFTDLILESANPLLQFKDTNAVVSRVNAEIAVNLTDLGDGTEDADISIKQQIAGTLTEVAKFDSDGYIYLNNTVFISGGSFFIKNTGTNSAISFRDDDCTDDDNNAKIYINCTDTGSGTEDCDVIFQQQINGLLTTWLTADADAQISFTRSTRVIGGWFAISAGQNLYFDDGSNTYITQSISDVLDTYVGGVLAMRFSESTTIIPEFKNLNSTFGVVLSGEKPLISFLDTNASDGDQNATIYASATDTGSGTEDVDVIFQQQIAGTLTTWLTADADGGVALGAGRNLVTSGNVILAATKDIYFDGGSDTYITESSADVLDTYVGGVLAFRMTENTTVYTQFLSSSGVAFSGPISSSLATISSTAPTLEFKDTDASDGDVNAKIYAQATDTGSTTEDVDVVFQQQINGILTVWLHADADGGIDFERDIRINTGRWLYFDGAGSTAIGESSADVLDIYVGGINAMTITESGNESFFEFKTLGTNGFILKSDTDRNPSFIMKNGACTDDDINFKMYANATDTGSGTEDIDVIFQQQIAGILTTFLTVDADGQIDFARDITVPATDGLFLDGGIDTYLYEAAADRVDLVVGGVALWSARENGTYNQVIISPGAVQNLPATPSLAFYGDGTFNDGFYNSAAGIINVALGGVYTWDISSTNFRSATAFGPYIAQAAASLTAPAYSFRTDTNTGIGASTAGDMLAIIAGGQTAQIVFEGNGEVSTILSGTVVETITDATTNGTTTITKVGENFTSTVSIGDALLVHGGTTTADYGTYIVVTVTDNENLVVDRAFSGSNSDVDFHIIADGVAIENSTNSGVARLHLPAGSVSKPSLSFNDEDTGFYGGAAGEILISNSGINFWVINGNYFGGTNAGDGVLNRNGGIGNSTTPAYGFVGDLDTGIMQQAADAGGLCAGTVEILRWTENGTYNQVIINPSANQNDAAHPALAFYGGGAFDTGFYASADDAISVTLGGANTFLWSGTSFRGLNVNSGNIINEAASITNPTLNPNASDLDTGIGADTAGDQLALIAGGATGQLLVENAGWGVSTHWPEITTPTAVTNYWSIYGKTNDHAYWQDGAGSEWSINLLGQDIAEMYMFESAVTVAINTVSIYHAIQGAFSTGDVNGWTFVAGSTGAITAFADAGGGQVTVTSAGHSLSTGDVVTISGTTNYNGTFIIANAQTNTFEITDTWVSNDATGTWDKPDHLKTGSNAAGKYRINLSISGEAAATGKQFSWQIFKNATAQNKIAITRDHGNADLGSMGASGFVDVVANDIIWLGIMNSTDATDFELEHANINMSRV